MEEEELEAGKPSEGRASFSFGILFRASNHTVKFSLASTDGVMFERGNLQLMSQLRTSRQDGLGVVSLKRVLEKGISNPMCLAYSSRQNSERYSRVGAGDTNQVLRVHRRDGWKEH
jgi:hypothetical protein